MTGTPSYVDDDPRLVARIERWTVVAILALMVFLPVMAVLVRWIANEPFPFANMWTQALNLWLAFLGASIAARTQRHLSLSTGSILKIEGRKRELMAGFTGAVATAVTALLAYASMELVIAEQASSVTLPGGVPAWVVQLVMPVGFLAMAIRIAWHSTESMAGRLGAVAMVILAASLALVPIGSRTPIVWAGGFIILVAVALGAPIFSVLGGMAMLLFYGQPLPTPISAVPAETYGIVASPNLPALPLFTLAGYLLAEGGASKRLVGLFRAWFGWMPGGVAAAAVLVCAFFTTFTGASGVTILALGGLLLPILTAAGYSERFAIGLLAASGSIGLLFPPSLPVILYGVVSHVPIDDLFVSGIVPGFVLVSMVILLSLIQGRKEGVKRGTFDWQIARTTLWEARWEVLLPVLVLWGIFGGFLTVFEAAACTAAYALLIEVVLHRDLSIRVDIPRIFTECGQLMGGVLIILGVAMGLTNFLVDAEVPMRITGWVEAHIGNKIAFILMLNVFLLVVGCLMDIYSAIMVVVPLIIPMAAVFNINPIHLGILFLANLELGYLTPPVGMNLFLASYRFDRPLTSVYRMALPFLGVLAIGVLIIAYVPPLTMWPHDADAATAPPSIDDPLLEQGEGDSPSGESLPLGTLDLDALLSGDDDGGDDDSAVPEPAPEPSHD